MKAKMGLRIIYGKSGSGKSEYCFSEISKIIEKEKKIYTILSFFVIIKLYHFRESRYREENIYCY